MRLGFLVFSTTLLFLISTSLAKDTSLDEKIKEKQALISKASKQEKNALKELEKIAKEIEILSKSLTKIKTQIDIIEKETSKLNSRIGKLKREEDKLKEKLSKELGAIITISKTGWLNLLFAPQNINEFLKREDYLYVLIESELYKISKIKKAKEDLKQLQEKLKEKLKRLKKQKKEYEEKERKLKLLRERKKAWLEEIRRNKKLYKETLEILLTAKREIARLAQEIVETQKRLEEAKKEGRSNSPKKVSSQIILRPLFEVKGYLYPPVEGRILRFFGLDRDLFTGEWSFSPGIFIGAPTGTKVVAPFSAKVVKIRWIKGQGKVVVLDHGYEFASLIGGLGDTKVLPGQEVRTGELLGTVGGSPYGPSGVYYELRYGSKPQNPLEWINLKKLKILR